MRNVIHKLSNGLEMLKGFSTGYTTKNDKAMIVNVEGVNYKLTIERLDENELTVDTVEKYL